jgi:uncharacterized protein DUF2497
MSRPAASSDPSMDEILASIRKIIAEEPPASRPVLEPRAKSPMPVPPAPPGPPAREPDTERSSPMFGRLAEALRGARSAVATAAMREPSARFDDDLSDLIETGSAAPAPPQAKLPPAGVPQSVSRGLPPSAPPPSARSLPPNPQRPNPAPDTWTGAYPSRGGPQSDVAREEARRRPEPASPGALASAAVKDASAYAPARPPEAARTPAPDLAKPVQQGSNPSAVAAAAAKPTAEKLNAPGSSGAATSVGLPPPASMLAKPEPPGAGPAPARPPQGSPAGKPSEAADKPSLAGIAKAAATPAGSEARGSSAVSTAPPNVAKAASAAPLKSDAQKPAPPASPPTKGPEPTGSGMPAGGTAAALTRAPTPAGGKLPPAPQGEADTSAAAASALGALAAGLAASSSKAAGSVLPEPPPLPPLPLPPLAARLQSAMPLPPALPASAGAAGPEARPAVSLEAFVAELVQPMLRQWLADNLPRIVEEAVRAEVAANLKSGRPPRG